MTRKRRTRTVVAVVGGTDSNGCADDVFECVNGRLVPGVTIEVGEMLHLIWSPPGV